MILDLDETLIHGSETELGRAEDFRVGSYRIYCRPYLNEFLAQISEWFHVAIWSSASADYVQPIATKILADLIEPVFIWSRSRCTQRYDAEWQREYYVKDLKKAKRLGFDLSRILIVDDTRKKVERNYGNAIIVSPFVGDSDDDELVHLARYLRTIKDVPNVRGLEKRGWRNGIRGG